jgi:hypothetical protein
LWVFGLATFSQVGAQQAFSQQGLAFSQAFGQQAAFSQAFGQQAVFAQGSGQHFAA